MNVSNKKDIGKKANKRIAIAGSERDFWGYTCIVIGLIFTLLAIFLFIFSNRMNFFAQKTSATVLSRSDIETESGDKKQMLTVTYRVGNENVVTSYEYNKGFIEEDVVSIDIYYNVKNPRFVIDDGWSFYAIPVFVLGILNVLIGLCVKGYILQELHLFEEEPSKKATQYQKEVFAVKKKSVENLFPFSAAMLMFICGIVFLVTKAGWGAYLFMGFGLLGVVYIGLELVPNLFEWNMIYRKYKMSKIKAKVTDIEVKEIGEEDKKES